LFLFTLSSWLLLRYVHSGGNKVITAAGLVTGLLILSRFNMMGLPVVIIVLLILYFVIRQPGPGFREIVTGLALFVAGLAFVLSLWALRNYLETGRYVVVPRHHMGARWAVPATISPSDSVSPEYRPVHEIFLRTREVLLEAEQARVYRMSSLMEYGFIRKMNNNIRPQVSGYLMYSDSEPDLLGYYGLDDTPEGILLLNEMLKPFYSQIAGQHREELRRFRIYSLLNTYELIAGERRWRAARRAGLAVITAIVRTTDDLGSVERALVENLHRKDLTPLEEASAYKQLIEDFSLTHEQVSSRVGKSRSSVTNTLRLLSLPAAIQALLADGRLSAGHAKALLGTPDRAFQEQLARRAVAESWSVRALE